MSDAGNYLTWEEQQRLKAAEARGAATPPPPVIRPPSLGGVAPTSTYGQVPKRTARVPLAQRSAGAIAPGIGSVGFGFTQGSWNLPGYNPMTGPIAARPGQVDDWIRTNYPYMASFLNNPDVGPILRRAALEGWDEGRLYGAVQATSWWRSTSASARQWDALLAEDPAEASRLAAQTAANMQNRARSLGVNMSTGQIQSLAMMATRNGWTDNQIVDRLLENVNWASLAGGDLTALRDTVKEIGANYLVQVSDATAQSYARAIASGEMSEQGVASVMQKQARSRYSWMADEIDQGISPAQMFMPIRDTIADELAMAPEAVNMMDPKWMGMMEVADKGGLRRAATIDEARMAARRDPRWANTSRAQEMLVSAAASIREVFGRRPI